MSLTATRAGRGGPASERKSRTGALCRQNGQVSGAASPTAAPASAIGASQRPHASVPVASVRVRSVRRNSSCAPTGASGSERGSGSSMPRNRATQRV